MASIQRLTVRYGVAVLAVAAAIALVLIPVIGKGLTAVVFLAVFVSARYGGLGPGLLATMLIALIAASVCTRIRTSLRGGMCRFCSLRSAGC